MGKRDFYWLCLANIVLLISYVVVDIAEWDGLLQYWNSISQYPDLYVVGISWNPFLLNMYVGSQSGRTISIPPFSVYNLSFMVLLAIVVINLASLWMITHKVSQ